MKRDEDPEVRIEVHFSKNYYAVPVNLTGRTSRRKFIQVTPSYQATNPIRALTMIIPTAVSNPLVRLSSLSTALLLAVVGHLNKAVISDSSCVIDS